MRCGNQARTSGGMTVCTIEMPAPMTMVAINSDAVLANAPRAAEPAAESSRPVSSAGSMPNRAMSSAPGTAAIANSIGGRLESQPMPVSDRCRSACRSGTTGGTAKTVIRRQAPTSQNRRSTVTDRPADSADMIVWAYAATAVAHFTSIRAAAYMMAGAKAASRVRRAPARTRTFATRTLGFQGARRRRIRARASALRTS